MEILLDSCVWGKAKFELQNFGFNVEWIGDRDKDPGDDEVLNYAFQKKKVLITLDKDFGELAILKRQPHCGIIRLVNIAAKQQSVISSAALNKYKDELKKGAIITIDATKVRLRLQK